MSLVCQGCEKPNPTLQCPKCKELSLPPALFCGQECFKANWASHKAKHSPEEVAKYANTCSLKTMADAIRATFQFSGPLRPGLITPRRAVPASVARPDYVSRPDGTSPAEEQSYRSNKIPKNSAEKLRQIKDVCRLARQVLDIGIAAAVEGATTDAVDAAVHRACMERNLYPSPLGYNKFPKSCCTSLNEVICHGIPDSTVMKNGDILNIDVSCYSKDGVHADLNETVFIGTPSPEDVLLVHTTHESMMRAIRTVVKQDGMYKHIGDCIAPFAEANGFSVVRNICGHGVGEMFHCAPNIPHYSNNKTPGKMALGHVFTIEPMINAGTWHDILWPDDWTAATKDGKRSAQFEHTIAVTPEGAEVFTFREGEDKRPHYQVQLDALGIPLPELKEP